MHGPPPEPTVLSLPTASSVELDLADEANKAVHMAWIQARTPGMRVDDGPELLVVDCGLPSDTFNLVLRARLARPSARARIAAVAAGFERAGRPFTWWVGPADRPADLASLLLDAGFLAAGTEPVMAVDLMRLPTVDLSPSGLRIEPATSTERLGHAATILASLANPPAPDVLRFYRAATPALLAPDSPIHFCVGYLDRAPVACAEVAFGGGVAGLYNVATLVEHRRKGFATALTVKPLLDARDRGYRTAVLQASPDGEPVYRRVGFGVTGWFTEYHLPRSPE
jgi:ribosomal protein S18 acetylase RimI-like enzyme